MIGRQPLWLARALGGASLLVIALAVFALLDRNRIDDDAYMFVRYADNLVASGRVAWNPAGEATYGLTSLGYFGLVALLRMVLRADPAFVLLAATSGSGVAFVLLAAVLARKAAAAERSRAAGDRAAAFVLAGLALASSSLAAHFVSGMDAAFALGATSVVHVAQLAWVAHRTRGRELAAGLLGGSLLWVRPDLLLFGIGVPLLLVAFSPTPAARRSAMRAAGWAMACAALLATFAWLTLGSPLPLALYGKVVRGYGADMRAAYAGFAGRELAIFARDFSLFLLIAAVGLVVRLRTAGRSGAGLDLALWIAVLAFLGFHQFLVLPIMGDHQRFQYPALPALVVLAVRGGTTIAHACRTTARAPALLVAAACVAAGAVLVMGTMAARRIDSFPRFASFRVLDHARDGWPARVWVRLDRIATLPDDVVLATTEVGLPGVLNPRKVIIDLAGLNDREFARDGFSAARLFARARPDLFYLTTRHYAEIRTSILRHPGFAAEYEVLQPPAGLAIAIRRDGAHAAAIRAALQGR